MLGAYGIPILGEGDVVGASDGTIRKSERNKGRSEKFSDFLDLSVNISKTVADTAKVTIND